MTKYQMIFRHLLKCKYLERLLSELWLEEKKVTQSFLNGLKPELYFLVPQLSHLRAKMLHFIQQIVYFMFFEVINPQWNEFNQKLNTVI
jgi:gamma-tubulin complex component 2